MDWKSYISAVFKKNGKPFIPTDGQVRIFEAILNPNYPFVWINAPTRYGKSEISAMALLIGAAIFNLKIPIVGGSLDKANKIMEYVLEHIGDNKDLYEGLINTDLKDIEALKVQRSKSILRWRDGGWIYITSIEQKNLSKEGEKVVGEGGDIVFLEEAGLIRSKEQFSKVLRMPEGKIAKLVMAGNCFENSIFEEAYKDDDYYKVKIELEEAFNEGRLDRERVFNFIKPKITYKDWLRFYEGKFPQANLYGYFKPHKYDFLPPLDKLNIFGAMDLALGEKEGKLTGIVVLGKHKETGQIYEVESIGEKMLPDEAIRTVLNLPYKFTRFGIEEVQFQKYFKDIIDKKSKELGKYIPFTGIKQSIKKEERIESMEPYVNTRQILFKGDNELWNEMINWPNVEYNDVLDALEMAFRLVKEIKIGIYRL
jgi:predicted phage terminase large subunit-like protein